MRSRPVRSSSVELTERTRLKTVSIPDGFMPFRPWFRFGFSATMPPIRPSKPRVGGGNSKMCSEPG